MTQIFAVVISILALTFSVISFIKNNGYNKKNKALYLSKEFKNLVKKLDEIGYIINKMPEVERLINKVSEYGIKIFNTSEMTEIYSQTEASYLLNYFFKYEDVTPELIMENYKWHHYNEDFTKINSEDIRHYYLHKTFEILNDLETFAMGFN